MINLISSPFNPSSPQALSIANLFYLALIISAFIFIIVTGSLIYIMVRYRSRPGDGEPKQVLGERKLEITWTVVPLLMLIFLFAYTAYTMHRADPSPESHQQPDLVVIGHQWWWEVHYPQSGVVTANEIHLPIGKRFLVLLKSEDVIHDFWVPQLARKMDTVPGHPNTIWLEADRAGIYLGACSEYCGTQHAWMRIRVIARLQSDFDLWQQEQLHVPTTPTVGEAARGAQIFQERTCANCHAIAGTRADARIGPDLTHLRDRQTIGAGVIENTPSSLAKWLANTQSVKPGSLMPNMRLSDSEVNALVAYLEGLK
ncbi:MAG: cytochrome c oxidase subunit II [Ignavibacteriales bacterium]